MNRPLASVAIASALLLSLYACSSDSSSDDRGSSGSSGSSSGTSGSSGSSGDPDARVDGPTTTDAQADAAIDGDAPVDAGPPVVRFIGRFDTAPAAGPKVAWPGAQIIARFAGTEVKATFSDEMLYSDYGADRWQAVIDGVDMPAIQLDRTQPTTYTLATGLPLGPHSVELHKLTEGNVGTTQFRGFDFSGGVLLPPPLPKNRHLQFLGDSASNGYGVDGANAACSFSAATENERKSYPSLIAHDLLAESHNLSAGGKGIFQNNYRPGDDEVFPILYQHVGIYADSPLWDFTKFVPDVVWVTLGGNDYGKSSDPAGASIGAPPAGQFQVKYDAFVGTIRTQYPNAHIFCTVAPSLSDVPADYSAYSNVKGALQNVVNARAAADAKIHYFEFTRSLDSDLTGCEGHPNVAKHRKMADEAIVVIKQKTGW